MKVTSALLTTMSGKIGGAVASTSRGGVQYFRKLVIPSNPRTSLQTAIRQAVASVAAYWRGTLTEEQQEAWWDAATGGQTGQGLFAKVNNPRRYALASDLWENVTDDPGVGSPTFILTPPPAFSVGSPPADVVIDDSANTLTVSGIMATDEFLTVDTVDDTHPGICYIYASHQQDPSRFSRQHPYRLVQAAVFTNLASMPANLPVDLAALGFTTTAGKVMYVKLIFASAKGRLSVPLERRVEITA